MRMHGVVKEVLNIKVVKLRFTKEVEKGLGPVESTQ